MNADDGGRVARSRGSEMERAALTRAEQRSLCALERTLFRDDPRFVTRFEAQCRRGRVDSHWWQFWR